jgi:hypothetical protein
MVKTQAPGVAKGGPEKGGAQAAPAVFGEDVHPAVKLSGLTRDHDQD